MTSFADRNWKDFITYGNIGLTGNFLQKVTKISADHNYDPGDGLLAVDTTSSEVILTMPPVSSWPLKDYRIVIPIMHVAGSNNVKIKLSGTDTFLLGNTYFNLGSVPFNFDFYVINSDDLTMYGMLSELTIKAAASFSGTWAHTSWATLAVVPLADVDYNDQSELFLYQSYNNGAIAEVSDVGDGTVLMTDGAHGLFVGDTIIISGTTSYNDEYTVASVPDDNHFTVTATFVDDETGIWTRHARCTILADAQYTVSFSAEIDSTGGSAWDAYGGIYKNEILLDNTKVTVSGSAGQNKNMNLSPKTFDFEAGDFIDLRMDNGTFTGNLTSAMFQIESKAL